MRIVACISDIPELLPFAIGLQPAYIPFIYLLLLIDCPASQIGAFARAGQCSQVPSAFIAMLVGLFTLFQIQPIWTLCEAHFDYSCLIDMRLCGAFSNAALAGGSIVPFSSGW